MSWRDDATTLQASQSYLENLVREGQFDDAKEYIKEAFHDRARVLHPDAGGTPEEFREVEAARSRLVAWVGRDRNCFECRGTGRTTTGSGLSAREVKCPICKGTTKHRAASGAPSTEPTTR